MSSNNNRNRNRSQQNRQNGKRPAPEVTTAQRAAQAGAKVPEDKKAVEVDYMKHPEKCPGMDKLISDTSAVSFEDETLLKYRLARVVERLRKAHDFQLFDAEGKSVSLFDENGDYAEPVDADGNEIALFDNDKKPVNIDEYLANMRRTLEKDMAIDPEEHIRNFGSLVDLMADKFAKDPMGLKDFARGDEGLTDIIRLATIFVTTLGESGRSKS